MSVSCSLLAVEWPGWVLPGTARPYVVSLPSFVLQTGQMENRQASHFRSGSPREYWSWSFGRPGPPVEWTATVGEAARAAAIRIAEENFGTGRLDRNLHGPSSSAEPTDGRHLHAFWLPRDADGDGLIDRLDVLIDGGASPFSRKILARLQLLQIHGHGSIPIFSRNPDADRFEARLWISVTPYVGPRFESSRPGKPARPGLSAAEQLAKELRQRRLADGLELPPAAVLATPIPPRSAAAFRLRARASEGDTLRPRAWFTILFEKPVTGPLAFGLGAHFGLGQFIPFPHVNLA